MRTIIKDKQILSKKHLETLRGLTQFERAWHIIDSHLRLYDELKTERSANKYLVKQLNNAITAQTEENGFVRA